MAAVPAARCSIGKETIGSRVKGKVQGSGARAAPHRRWVCIRIGCGPWLGGSRVVVLHGVCPSRRRSSYEGTFEWDLGRLEPRTAETRNP